MQSLSFFIILQQTFQFVNTSFKIVHILPFELHILLPLFPKNPNRRLKKVADCKKHNLRQFFFNLQKLFFVYEANKTFGVAFDGGKIVFFCAFKERG